MRTHLADVDVTVTMTQPSPDAPVIVLATNHMHNGGFNFNIDGWQASYGTGPIVGRFGILEATGDGSPGAPLPVTTWSDTFDADVSGWSAYGSTGTGSWVEPGALRMQSGRDVINWTVTNGDYVPGGQFTLTARMRIVENAAGDAVGPHVSFNFGGTQVFAHVDGWAPAVGEWGTFTTTGTVPESFNPATQTGNLRLGMRFPGTGSSVVEVDSVQIIQTLDDDGNGAFAVRSEASTWSGVSAGDTVHCRALVRTIGGQTPTGCIGRFSFAGKVIVADTDGWDPQGVDGWHSLGFSATVPASYTGGPCYVIVGEWLPATTTSNDRMQVDNVIVSAEDVAFFDGHTEGSGSIQYRWVGTEDSSPSQQYTTGDTVTINTTDADAAFLGDIPSAVHTMTGQWQQSSSRDHPTPGKLSLRLIMDRPEHPAIDYESDVAVMVSVRGQQPFPFWRGWIDDIEITRRVVHHPDTRDPVVTWTWDITVGDILARAAATKINDTPWPKQSVFSGGHVGRGRLNAIQEASPIPLIAPRLITGTWTQPPWPSDWVRPRDVDNVDVLSLCQAMSPIGAQQVHESYDGLTFRGTPGINELAWFELLDEVDMEFIPFSPNRVWTGTRRIGPGSEDYDKQYQPNTTTIPADAIIETSRRINRATLLNEVSIGWYDQTETQRDSYRRNTTRQASTSQHRVATDYIEDDQATPGPPELLLTAADSWLAMTGRPTRALTSTQVLTDLVPTEAITRLCTLGLRGTVGVGIDGPPDDLPLSWRVIAGSATVNAGLLDLALTLEPASLSGQEPMTWDEIPDPTTAQFSDGTPVLLDVKFKDAHTLPFAAFSHVAKSAVRLYDGPS